MAVCNALERAARRLAWTGKVSLLGGLWLGELAIWENNSTENRVLQETCGPRAATDGCSGLFVIRVLEVRVVTPMKPRIATVALEMSVTLQSFPGSMPLKCPNAGDSGVGIFQSLTCT